MLSNTLTQKPAKLRRLKVYEKLGPYYNSKGVARFPEIRLMGKWLQASGFMPGQFVEIIEEAGKLTIVSVPKEAI